MTAREAGALKVGDVVLVRMRVSAVTKPGTLGHHRGWIFAENISDRGLLGESVAVVSCSDAVTPADLQQWKITAGPACLRCTARMRPTEYQCPECGPEP